MWILSLFGSTSAARSSFVRNCFRAATSMASFTALMTICGSMPFSLLRISMDSNIDANLVASFFLPNCRGLPLELQVCSFDTGQRDVYDAAFGGLNQDLLAFNTAKKTFPILLLFNRFVRDDFCLLSRKTGEVRRLGQLA